MKTIKTFIVFSVVILLALEASGQVKRRTQRNPRDVLRNRDTHQTPIERRTQTGDSLAYADIFRSVENGIVGGNVGAFSQYFGAQVHVSLPGGESGYYSSNQAYSILQNYFGSRRTQSFRFSTYGESPSTPYATGAGRFVVRGAVETVQLYVAVSRIENRWILSQVNIY